MNNRKTARMIQFAIALYLSCGAALVNADDHLVKIVGRQQVTVTTPQVHLGDLADVTPIKLGNDDSVIALKKILLGTSPKPGQQTTVAANQIIEALKSSGVKLSSVGYSLPRVITVQRAGRKILPDEVKSVIESFFAHNDREVALKGIQFDQEIFVAPGSLKIEAQPIENSRPGSQGFSMLAVSGTEQPIRFDVTANLDEWVEVPVAARAIQRGVTVDQKDIAFARYHISAVPKDAAFDPKEINGKATSGTISSGDVFRTSRLSIPAVIAAGSTVTLVYKSGALEATATGVAMEPGTMGQEIKVRNDTSKRIVLGKVLEPGIVGVSKK